MQENHQISEYRQTLKEKILDAAMTAFWTYGIKAVKMDDIASCLSISKRTLYELYSNKEDLLLEGVRKWHNIKRDDMSRFAVQNHNVMDIIIYAFRQKIREIRMTNPLFYSDVDKYPKLIRFFDQEKAADRYQFIKFLQRGTDQGYFCKNLNHEIIASIIDIQNKLIMANRFYDHFSMETVLFNLLFLSLRGLCTQKGINVLDHFLQTYHESDMK